MRVLSVRQPWASLLVRGVKRIEIRSWDTDYRGTLAIHASSKKPGSDFAEWIDEDPKRRKLLKSIGLDSLEALQALPRSAIVGTVEIKDVLDIDGMQSVATAHDGLILGSVHNDQCFWLVDGAVEIEPIGGINGKLNLWSLDAPAAKLVSSRLMAGKLAPPRTRSPKAPLEIDSGEDGDAPDSEADESNDEELLTPSPQLAAAIGDAPLPRRKVIEKLWSYIKAHDLQDKQDPRKINCDIVLQRIFRKPSVDLFGITKPLSRHLA